MAGFCVCFVAMTLIWMLLLVVAAAAVSDAIRRKQQGDSLFGHVDVPWPLVGAIGGVLVLVFVIALVGAIV